MRLEVAANMSTDLDCSGFSAVIAIIIILRGHNGCQLRGGALRRVGLFDDCQAVELGNVTQQFHVKMLNKYLTDATSYQNL